MPRMNSTALRDENKVGIKHVNKNALSRLLKIILSLIHIYGSSSRSFYVGDLRPEEIKCCLLYTSRCV